MRRWEDWGVDGAGLVDRSGVVEIASPLGRPELTRAGVGGWEPLRGPQVLNEQGSSGGSGALSGLEQVRGPEPLGGQGPLRGQARVRAVGREERGGKGR